LYSAIESEDTEALKDTEIFTIYTKTYAVATFKWGEGESDERAFTSTFVQVSFESTSPEGLTVVDYGTQPTAEPARAVTQRTDTLTSGQITITST